MLKGSVLSKQVLIEPVNWQLPQPPVFVTWVKIATTTGPALVTFIVLKVEGLGGCSANFKPRSVSFLLQSLLPPYLADNVGNLASLAEEEFHASLGFFSSTYHNNENEECSRTEDSPHHNVHLPSIL